MKQGQTTTFIIAGLVLILSVATLFFIATSLSNEKLDRGKKTTFEALDAATVQRYISTCADNGLQNALELIAGQGGYINPTDYIKFGEINVAFAITQKINAPPNYPCPESYASQAPAFCKFPKNTEFIRFGQDKLPELNQGLFSIRNQIEKYLRSYAKQCLEQQIDSSYEFNASEPEVKVTFENDAVKAKIDFNIKLSRKDSQTQLIMFEANAPVRFRDFYEAIKDFIAKDINNIDFNARAPEQLFNGVPVKIALLSPPIQIKSFDVGKDDILALTDDASVIRGKKFTFNIARKNRPPVLDYVGDPFITGADLKISTATILSPIARDPDEDTVTLSYSGELEISQGSQLGIDPNKFKKKLYLERITASDGFEKDWQDVRIVIE